MNFYVVICVVACAFSSASSASVRLQRQVWREQFPDHFHFPDDPPPRDAGDFNKEYGFPRDTDDFTNVIDFPGTFNRPDFNQNGFRPPHRTTTTTTTTTTRTPTSTAAWSSTPRTYHLAPEGCDCPFTPQFNPVCGSDGNTYKNSGLLKCFRRCGINVSQRRMGAC